MHPNKEGGVFADVIKDVETRRLPYITALNAVTWILTKGKLREIRHTEKVV